MVGASASHLAPQLGKGAACRESLELCQSSAAIAVGSCAAAATSLEHVRRRAAGVSNQVSWTLYNDAATGTSWRARPVRVKAIGLQLDVAQRLRFDSRKPLALLAMTATGVCARAGMPS